jgi:HAD superfamily hydrolase (TIGR01549 family)
VTARIPVFDLDGTLLDSDEALVVPFLQLGVPRAQIEFGEPVAEACARLDVPLDAYVAAYDPAAAQPFPGVDDLVRRLDRWGVCSNKHPRAAMADLARWGWQPTVALFSDAFDWGQKRLAPVLDALDVDAPAVLYVGDSEHDRATAAEAGCSFALAGWNPRATPTAGELVLSTPAEVLDHLGA